MCGGVYVGVGVGVGMCMCVCWVRWVHLCVHPVKACGRIEWEPFVKLVLVVLRAP